MGLSRRTVLKAGGAIGAAGLVYAGYKLSGPGGNVTEGSSRAAPVQGDDEFPSTADVVVIGGGIVGTCAALFLAQKGVSVVLCEKGAIAGEASGRAQGQVSSALLDPSKLDLISMSKDIWAGLNELVQGETGYRRNGLVSPCPDEATLGMWEDWLQAAGDKVPTARMLTADEANRALPSSQDWAGAYYDPSDGGAEPTLSAPAIAEGARRLGAKILVPCAVRGIEKSGGKVSAVVTENGTIRTSSVLLAGGCWSTKFLGNLGIDLPSVNMFSSLARVTMSNPARTIGDNFDVPGAIVRRHIDGSYSLGATSGRIPVTPQLLSNISRFSHIMFDPPWDVSPHLGGYFFRELAAGSNWSLDEMSPFEKNRILQPTVNQDLLDTVQANIADAFPQFGAIQIKERWAGALSVVPDNIPVISTVPDHDGLYLATGFTYGVTMGPAGAKLAAQLITGETPDIDIGMFRYSRFTDGSELHFTH